MKNETAQVIATHVVLPLAIIGVAFLAHKDVVQKVKKATGRYHR